MHTAFWSLGWAGEESKARRPVKVRKVGCREIREPLGLEGRGTNWAGPFWWSEIMGEQGRQCHIARTEQPEGQEVVQHLSRWLRWG